MIKNEWDNYANKLSEAGYKMYHDYYSKSDFYYAKTIKNSNGIALYIISYQFWNHEKYQEGAGYDVDINISLPAASALSYAELNIYPDEKSIEEIEDIAANYFLFCIKNNLTNYKK